VRLTAAIVVAVVVVVVIICSIVIVLFWWLLIPCLEIWMMQSHSISTVSITIDRSTGMDTLVTTPNRVVVVGGGARTCSYFGFRFQMFLFPWMMELIYANVNTKANIIRGDRRH
jgi:hypothetical protein